MRQLSPNLLIFHPGALGDGLLSLRALRALKTQFPGHRMIWFGHKALGEVLVHAQEVHKSYSFDRLNVFVNDEGNGLQEKSMASLFEYSDGAVGWLKDADRIWKDWLKSVGINNCILRSPHDPSLRSHHMADRYVETLLPWFSRKLVSEELEKQSSDEPLLWIDRVETVEQPCASKKKRIVLHPGSGGKHKCAPSALWAAIVNGLMARPNRCMYFVGGPADTDALQTIEGLMIHHKPTVLEGMDLLSVARILGEAQLFLGHDSGLSHLAARLGVPSVLLFGPTDPTKWSPRGQHVAVIRKYCHCVGKESIIQCLNKWCFSIPTNEVMAKAEELLGGMSGCSGSGASLEFDALPHVSCLG